MNFNADKVINDARELSMKVEFKSNPLTIESEQMALIDLEKLTIEQREEVEDYLRRDNNDSRRN